MVGGAATHSLESHSGESYSHELVRVLVRTPAPVGVGKYVTINYTLRSNGAIRHSRNGEGMYYGQCLELCGVDYSFMPIAVRVASEQEFTAWATRRNGNSPPAR